MSASPSTSRPLGALCPWPGTPSHDHLDGFLDRWDTRTRFASSMDGGFDMRMIRFAAAMIVVAAFGLMSTGVAQAGGNGAQTFTQIDKNVVEVDQPGSGNGNPCSGAEGTLT